MWCTWHQQEHRHWRAAQAVGMEGSESIRGHLLASLPVQTSCAASGTMRSASGTVSQDAGSCSVGRTLAHCPAPSPPMFTGVGSVRDGPTQLPTLCKELEFRREAFCCWCLGAQAPVNSPCRCSLSSFPFLLRALSAHPSISFLPAVMTHSNPPRPSQLPYWLFKTPGALGNPFMVLPPPLGSRKTPPPCVSEPLNLESPQSASA